jgi:hypothetical protein
MDVLELREFEQNSSMRNKMLNNVFHTKCQDCCVGNESLCIGCNTIKPYSDFSIRKDRNKPRGCCKVCEVSKSKQYKINNTEKCKDAGIEYRNRPEIKEKHKAYRQRPDVKKRNQEISKRPEIIEYHKQYRNDPEHKKKQSEFSKTYRVEYNKRPEVVKRVKEYYTEYEARPTVIQRREDNKSCPEFRERINKRMRERYATDPKYKMTVTMRSRFRQVVLNEFKGESVLVLVGCIDDHLIKWLEYQFDENMDWENHGEYWHVDHIKPCASFDFTNVEDQKECFHWTNLQPLFKIDNIIKSDTYNDKIKNKAHGTLQMFIDEYGGEFLTDEQLHEYDIESDSTDDLDE